MEDIRNNTAEPDQTLPGREKKNLEEMFQALEAVIRQMEESDVTLEQSFDLYSKGMDLLKQCICTIDEVEKKVLVLDENGDTYEF